MRLLAPLVIAFGLLSSSCAVSAPEPDPVRTGLVAEGRRLVELHCARCHAIGVAGDSPFSAAPPFRTLSRHYAVNALEEAFAEGVLVGHPAMPEFQFEPAQIDALVAYLESIQERRAG